MSPRTPLLLLGLVISIASVGCHNLYTIRIAATADPERISVFEPGTSIAVTFDPDVQPLSLYQDLALTIERQLQAMGFTVADERDAKILRIGRISGAFLLVQGTASRFSVR